MTAPTPSTPPAPSLVREPGATLWERVRLDHRLDLHAPAGGELWTAIDQRTGAVHTIEFLPAGSALPPATDLDGILRQLRACIPPRHPGLLPFYRIEGAWPDIAFVTGHHQHLVDAKPFASDDLRALDLAIALDRIQALAHILEELAASGARAHGAIAPTRLALLGGGQLLLTGYPHAVFFAPTSSPAFASPARRKLAGPLPSDDVFSLGAFAYHLLTGGSVPPTLNGPPSADQAIAAERARNNLPPLPASWPAGWDETIFAALQDDPARRPASARALIDALNGRIGRARLPGLFQLPALPPRRELERPRKTPLGRIHGAGARLRPAGPGPRAGSPADAPLSAADASPLHAFAQLRDARAALDHAQAEVARRETDTARRSAQLDQVQAEQTRQNERLVREQTELHAARAAYDSAHAALVAAQKILADAQAAHAAQARDLEQRIAAQRADAERQLAETNATREALRADAAKLAQTRQELTAATRVLDTEKARVAADRERNEQADRDLKTRLAALETRERTLLEHQQILDRVAGGSGPEQWSAFARRLEASQGEVQRKESDLLRKDSELQKRDSDFKQRELDRQRRESELQRRDTDAQKRDAEQLRREAELQRRKTEIEQAAQAAKTGGGAAPAPTPGVAPASSTGGMATSAPFANKVSPTNTTPPLAPEKKAEPSGGPAPGPAPSAQPNPAATTPASFAPAAGAAPPTAPIAAAPAAQAPPPPVATPPASQLPVSPAALSQPPLSAPLITSEPPPRVTHPPISVESPRVEPAPVAKIEPPEPAALASIPSPPPPPPTPPAPDIRKATLALPGGRRLHVFAGPVLRFGRQGDSDVLLVAIRAGQSQVSLALNREISRKHFELQVNSDGVHIIDGWSDDGRVSQHGVCLDGRRVPSSGGILRNGALLSVTTRVPGHSIPHWKVQMGARAESSAITFENPDGYAPPSLAFVHLTRMDDAPDDILIVLDAARLRDLGLVLADGSISDTAIVRIGGNFAWRVGHDVIPFIQGASPVPPLDVISLGYTTPSVSVPGA